MYTEWTFRFPRSFRTMSSARIVRKLTKVGKTDMGMWLEEGRYVADLFGRHPIVCDGE